MYLKLAFPGADDGIDPRIQLGKSPWGPASVPGTMPVLIVQAVHDRTTSVYDMDRLAIAYAAGIANVTYHRDSSANTRPAPTDTVRLCDAVVRPLPIRY